MKYYLLDLALGLSTHSVQSRFRTKLTKAQAWDASFNDADLSGL